MAEVTILPVNDQTVLELQQDFTLQFTYTTIDEDGETNICDFKTVLRDVPFSIDKDTDNILISYSSAVMLLGKARASYFAIKQNNNYDRLLTYPEILDTISMATLKIKFTPEEVVILSPAIEPTIPQDTRVLYVPNHHSLASYMLQWLSDKLKPFFQTNDHVYPPFVGNEATLVSIQENNEFASLITSFYFCCLLTISSGQVASKIISDLHWLVDEMENLIFIESHLPELQGAINNFSYFDGWSMERLIDAAFFGFCGIAKKQTKFDFIRDWITKRTPALHTSCKFKGSRSVTTSNLHYDITIPADFFATYTSLRRAVYIPVITGECDEEGPIMVGFTSQARMILDNIEMTTFEIAYKFAEACETEVHLLDPIIDQCEQVIRFRKNIYDQAMKEGEEYNYLYFYKNIPTNIQISNYPDLAYAAIQMKRKESDTFKQYAEMKHDGFISTKVIDELLKKPLLSDTTGSPVSDKASRFIASRGKKAQRHQPSNDEISDLINKLTNLRN